MVTAGRVEHRTRYRLLETLRQYGEERLDQQDATEVLRDRHLDHCTEAAERVSALLFTDDHERASTFLELEWDNLRAAFGWAITVERLDRVEQLVRVTLGHA